MFTVGRIAAWFVKFVQRGGGAGGGAKITVQEFLRVDQSIMTSGGKKGIKRSGINFEFQQLELDAIITDLIIQNFDSFNPMCN